MHSILRRHLVGSAAILAICAATAAPVAAAPNADALSVMQSNPNFSDWVEVLKFSGLTQYAQTMPDFTVFVPTNAAFDKNPGVLLQLLAARSRAFPETTLSVQFIRSHVITDIHPLSEFRGRTASVTSIYGTPIKIDGTQPGIYTVSWSSIHERSATTTISGAPIVTSNAIIYPVHDVVLSP